MAASTFFIPSVNMIGSGCLDEAANTMKQQGLRHALIVTDKVLNNIGVVAQVQQLLTAQQIESCVYDGTHPNPTTLNVKQGLALLQEHQCDCVISLGGGSPHDCAKGIALLATNGGDIKDYETTGVAPSVDRDRQSVE